MEYKSQHQDSADDFRCNIFSILDHQVQNPRGSLNCWLGDFIICSLGMETYK